MNIRAVFGTLGRVARLLSALLLLPAIVSLIYKEKSGLWFIAVAAVSLIVGVLLRVIFKTKNNVIYAREGIAIVGLVWLFMSAIGALPFVLSGQIPNYFDAFFETVSGFTTTGATILNDVECLDKGILFWRSFTHWLGGMGVLVFVMAIVPNLSDRSIHIMRAEMPGPVVGKLVPKAKDTAKILYLIYIVMTATETVLLVCGDMSLYEALVYSFGTAGTGGFGVLNSSVAAYSPYTQWVITAFMALFGVNFNLYFILLMRRFRAALSSRELWCYIGIILGSTAVISSMVFKQYGTVEETVRQSAFQTVSYMTTTGYSTVSDINAWPQFSKAILILLMFIGGCAGSTAGGLKLSRFMMLIKLISREFNKMLHPRAVRTVKFEGKAVDEPTLNSVANYFALYMICILSVFLIVSIGNDFGFESNFTAAVSCFNNIGPVFGRITNFSGYSNLSKVVLSFAMLLGRLEIYPMLLAFAPATWSKK